MSKYLGISFIIVAFILGIGFGYTLTPQYSQMSEETSISHKTDLGKADQNVDLRFIKAMIRHHLGAIDLAEQEKENTKRGILKDLAQQIIDDQKPEMEKLHRWKTDWYNDKSTIKIDEKTNLGEFDDNLDLRFLNAMIAHHEEAIELSKQIQAKSSRNDVLTLASQIITKQTKEIAFMKTLRGDLYEVYREEHR